MKGISHGVGYGEQKDVIPVQGRSMPMVRYYLPPIHKRLGVPDIVRAFGKLGIKTVRDFYNQVCDCVVCKGVVRSTLQEFSSFGDLHYSSSESKRKSQTPAAAKRCRYHFLLNRIRERDAMKKLSLEEVIDQVKQASQKWAKQPSVANDSNHLIRWSNALENEE